MFGLFKRKRSASVKPSRHAWESLSAPAAAPPESAPAYYGYARPELAEMVKREPRRALDLGCASGMLGASVKKRYPRAEVWGVELDPLAAAQAAKRLDRAMCANLDRANFEELGFPKGGFDLVFLADVLEHLYDPWKLLRDLRAYLTSDAQVVASLPNVRNFEVMRDALINGRFDYADAGLLDITHIRFFTKRTMIELFEQTGYRVAEVVAKYGGDVPIPAVETSRGRVDVEVGQIVLRALTPEDVDELRAYQYLISAAPA